MSADPPLIIQASAVAIDGRALLIEGPPGSGKSSLSLALIDRGAQLIGDDGVSLYNDNDRILASPPPNIAGLIEIRNVALVSLPVAPATPLALILSLQNDAERLPQAAQTRDILDCTIPVLAFTPGHIAPALRAEWALQHHGLQLD